MAEVIRAQGLCLGFRRWSMDRPRSIQEAVQRGIRRYRDPHVTWAVRDVDLAVEAGCTFGVIGRNGAGKSSLLRLIGGVLEPDRGRITVQGRVSGILELGSGFHPDLTGRENVFVCGVISGLTRSEVRQRFADVVAFAELEDFIDSPLRTYSDGMRMRLGFSIAVHCDAELLLIDEILAVGDLAFQAKCQERLEGFKRSGRTLVIVAHDPATLVRLCDRVLWIDQGRAVAVGEAEEVVAGYVAASIPPARGLESPA